MKREPLLSIIITSFTMERFKDICDLLNSIKVQSYRNIEVIFVVEQSERLYEKVIEKGNNLKLPNFKVIFRKDVLGLNAARNLGIKEASGEIIAFVDDDVILFPDWCEELIRTYEHDDSIIGVTGPAILLWDDKKLQKSFPDVLSWIIGGTSWLKLAEDKIVDIRNVGGMNHSFKREAFEKCGLYDVRFGCWKGERVSWRQLSGDEIEFSFRVRRISGKRIVFNPKMRVYHKVHKTKNMAFIAKRAFRSYYTKHLIAKIYPKESQKLSLEYKVLRQMFSKFHFQMFVRFLFKNPKIALYKMLIILIGIFFAGLGYLAYWIKPFHVH